MSVAWWNSRRAIAVIISGTYDTFLLGIYCFRWLQRRTIKEQGTSEQLQLTTTSAVIFSCHPGVSRTLSLLFQHFWWPSLRWRLSSCKFTTYDTHQSNLCQISRGRPVFPPLKPWSTAFTSHGNGPGLL